jgi:hypothetical protein
VVTVVKGDGDLRPLKVLKSDRWDCHDLSGCEFLLLPWLIRIRATIDVVDLLVSLWVVALGFFKLFQLISPFGHLEYFICETLESVTVSGLVLSLGVENADAIQEAFKFTQPGMVLLVVSRPFHRIDGMIRFPLLVMALGWARLVRVAQVIFLLLFPSVEGSLLDQGVLVSDGEHCFWRPRVFHGELRDQGRVSESLLEEHDNRLVIDLWDYISLVAEMLDKLPEGLSLLLDDAG